jgi:hypothetical protein
MLRGLVRISHGFLAGAFFALGIVRLSEPSQSRLALILVGGLYGVAVLGLMGLFRVERWAHLVTGVLAGPVPAALLVPASAGKEAAGMIALGALFGLLLGALELGRRTIAEERPTNGPASP